MTFKSEWSLSPLTIDTHHFYLYGFFLDKWRVFSINLPINFSLWLIETKSNSLFYETYFSQRVHNFPISQWEEQILAPLYDEFLDQKEQFEIQITN